DVGGVELAPFSRASLGQGQHLRFRARRRGARAYLAVAGALEARRSFGSAASDLAGGLGGRPLRAADRLELGPAPARPPDERDARPLARWYDAPGRLRFVPASAAPQAAVSALESAEYRVSPRSNRTGYLLDGPPVALPADGRDLSEPIAPGTIQV